MGGISRSYTGERARRGKGEGTASRPTERFQSPKKKKKKAKAWPFTSEVGCFVLSGLTKGAGDYFGGESHLGICGRA